MAEGGEEDQQLALEMKEPPENRTRLGIAGLVAAAVVSIVAVLVVGIFQLTAAKAGQEAEVKSETFP